MMPSITKSSITSLVSILQCSFRGISFCMYYIGRKQTIYNLFVIIILYSYGNLITGNLKYLSDLISTNVLTNF